MGTIDNALKGVLGTSYIGNFRFYFEPSKGLIVSDSHLPVVDFRTFASPHGVVLSTTDGAVRATKIDEQDILLTLLHIRGAKRIGIRLQKTTETQNAFHRLYDMWQLKVRFLAALGLQKNTNGVRSGLYILRDRAASIFMMDAGGAYSHYTYDVVLDLPSPELLHSVGAHVNPKAF
jgi:hypothetical protein